MIKYLQIVLFLILPMEVFAQQAVLVSGRVLQTDGQPASAISVNTTDKAHTTTTGSDGRYNFNLNPGTYKLNFTCVGFNTHSIAVTVKAGQLQKVADVILKENNTPLEEVVVTGQYAPQSLKNSVYMVRTINSEQIRLRNPNKIQDVLANQLGFRFSNDLTLGTSDVNMMGVSGQRVKILLDGVPLLDRGDTRESLNQIDINSIDHIEIVEGPMSVNYGTDALGGVINLITKRGSSANALRVNGRIQEESAGRKYAAAQGSGSHLANLGLNWSNQKWQANGNFTRNFFDGAQLGWMPKDQYLGSAGAGYRTTKLHVWYRLDAANETLRKDGEPNINTNIRTDARYITHRYMHQLQGEWQAGSRLSVNTSVAYTDYSRRTQTTTLNMLTGDRRLTLGVGEQDEAIFDNKFFRATAQYKATQTLSIQPGVEFNLTGSSGARILGTPTINDYAAFLSAEWQPASFISIRPGARFIHNSVYNAPPVVPSVNARLSLNKTLDIRLSYARGFRAPALRELYFNFFDASHSIRGNENLKAEFSDSFAANLSWQPQLASTGFRFTTALGSFYNRFSNLITTGYDPADQSIMTYINVDNAKTAGLTLDNTAHIKNLELKIGFAYTGIYSVPQGIPASQIAYRWYPEVSSSLLYHLKKIKADVSLFYKLNGALPTYQVNATNDVTLARRSAFSLADLTINKIINSKLTVAGGVKNLFNVTNVNSTAANNGGAHSTSGPVPMAYGRSYFLGLNFQFATNK